MGALHTRIEELGRQGALQLIGSPQERKALEAAVMFMSAEDPRTSFLFSGWCQTALPHKKLLDDTVWTLTTDYVTLMVEPGSMRQTNGVVSRVGVPYGSRARLILLYLQSEAIRTGLREIELGRSLRVWLGRMGIPIGGKSLKDVREQALRISRCRMSFQITQGKHIGLVNQNIVDTALFHEEEQGGLLETVRLSEGFFEQLKKHPVPLQDSAIRALSNNSSALDIYCWLAFRLHSLNSNTRISWAALHGQFGAGVKHRYHFKASFNDALQIALAVYPEARVDVEDAGLRLHPSPPPVASRRIATREDLSPKSTAARLPSRTASPASRSR